MQIALCLPAPDVAALNRGQMVVAISQAFLDPGRQFALCPARTATGSLTIGQYYNSNFLTTASQSLAELDTGKALVKSWARCERCEIINRPDRFDILSQLTVWTEEALTQALKQRRNLFLICLRVYHLSQVIETEAKANVRFISLPRAINLEESNPVLSQNFFDYKYRQTLNRELPKDPEMEDLLQSISGLARDLSSKEVIACRTLERDIKTFLGSSDEIVSSNSDPAWEWIKKIKATGHSSDGHAFEKLVRRSMIELGFKNSNTNPKASLDPESTGGAGGLDFYCEMPYPVIGECKASSKETIPTDVCSQLTYLGQTHATRDYNTAVKLIISRGSLNNFTRNIAQENKMNVIKPETLQRLVTLKAQFPGSINLFELKLCLSELPFGEEADGSLNQYIDAVEEKVRLRSQVIKAVQQLSGQRNQIPGGTTHTFSIIEIRVHHNAVFNDNQTDSQVRDILVELSSPLVGYLGRKEEKFYLIRELKIDE